MPVSLEASSSTLRSAGKAGTASIVIQSGALGPLRSDSVTVWPSKITVRAVIKYVPSVSGAAGVKVYTSGNAAISGSAKPRTKEPSVVLTSVNSTAMPSVMPAAAWAALSTLISSIPAKPSRLVSVNSSTSVCTNRVGVLSPVTPSLLEAPVSLAGSRCTPVGTGVAKFSISRL